MELKDFVAVTLTEIIEGIKTAQVLSDALQSA